MARIDFNVNKIAKDITDKWDVVVRKVALDGARQLITQTPVDTGRAKANWSIAKNTLPSDAFNSKIVNLSKQTRLAQTYECGETMYLYNNLEYMIPLEFGTSKQAPAGWIRATANTMQKKLNEIKNIL